MKLSKYEKETIILTMKKINIIVSIHLIRDYRND